MDRREVRVTAADSPESEGRDHTSPGRGYCVTGFRKSRQFLDCGGHAVNRVPLQPRGNAPQERGGEVGDGPS